MGILSKTMELQDEQIEEALKERDTLKRTTEAQKMHEVMFSVRPDENFETNKLQ